MFLLNASKRILRLFVVFFHYINVNLAHKNRKVLLQVKRENQRFFDNNDCGSCSFFVAVRGVPSVSSSAFLFLLDGYLDVTVEEVEDSVKGKLVRVTHVEAVASSGHDGGVEGRGVGEHGARGLDEVGELVVNGARSMAISAAKGDVTLYFMSVHTLFLHCLNPPSSSGGSLAEWVLHKKGTYHQ